MNLASTGDKGAISTVVMRRIRIADTGVRFPHGPLNINGIWARSSVGRALLWHRRGRRSESGRVHTSASVRLSSRQGSAQAF